MSTIVTYKGNTLTTVNNTTKTLKTAGKYMEDNVTLVDDSKPTYTDVENNAGGRTITVNNGIITTNKVAHLVATEFSTRPAVVENESNMWTPIDSDTYATLSTDSETSSGSCRLTGFDFSELPSNAIVSSYAIKIKGSSNSGAGTNGRLVRLNNAWVGGSTKLSYNASPTIITYNMEGVSWEELYAGRSTLEVHTTVSELNNPTRIYGVEIEVTYNLPINEVIYGTTELIDLTADTVTPASLLQGYTAHDKSGATITGTASGNMDMPVFTGNSSATAIVCDKTYTECLTYITNNMYGAILKVEGEALTYSIEAYETSPSQGAPLRYVYMYNGVPSLQITYESDGTISMGDPDALTEVTFTQNGTYNATKDGPNPFVWDKVVVNVPAGTPKLQSKTTTPTTSQQTITADNGYDGLSQVTVSAMPSGAATAPTSITGTAATVSTGTNTLTLTKSVSVTPSVTAGYVSSGTAGNSSVSLTASISTKAAATITPSTTNQTIAAGTYLTGAQTIAGDADLVASNIVSGVQIFGVTGNVVLQNYYTGSSAPSSSLGQNGDIYIQQ